MSPPDSLETPPAAQGLLAPSRGDFQNNGLHCFAAFPELGAGCAPGFHSSLRQDFGHLLY